MVNYSIALWNHSSLSINLNGSMASSPSLDHAIKEKPWNFLRQSAPMLGILTLAYVVVFILSIVNNSLVVSVIFRSPQMRTITNLFIANLAVADILVSILVLPITLLSNLFEGKTVFSVIKILPTSIINSHLIFMQISLKGP